MENRLFYGDNLAILRQYIGDDCVDLIYLDPPFKSSTAYNLIYTGPAGHHSDAQVEAFVDTWHWGEQAEREFDALLHQSNTDVAEMMRALRRFLGENDMMAYLTMMASRLLDLHRVLKSTGSLYLHCDPTASHYIKVVLDGIFGKEMFRNEITWKRTFAHGNVGRNYGCIADTIFYYTKGDKYTWNQPFASLTDEERSEKYPNTDTGGRRWQSVTLRNPSVRPNLYFPYKASNGETYQPHQNGWSCNMQRLRLYDREGRLHFPAKVDGALRLKMYEDESPGERVQNIWVDIPPIGAQAAERLGYPTQKPLALLERIIRTASNEGDVVLDPFCGCGTAIEAAQQLRRRWLGIDITHLAIALVETRLRRFPNAKFIVIGRPEDMAGAQELALRDKYQFQYWVCSLLDAQPFRQKKKGADGGIDGLIYFVGHRKETEKIVVSVKGGANVSVQMIRDLRGVLERENAAIALFVTLTKPTPPMEVEAAKAGFATYESERYARIQILTIEDLLSGKTRARHPGALLDMRANKRRPDRPVQSTQTDLFSAVERGKAGEVLDLTDDVFRSTTRKRPARSTRRSRGSGRKQGAA